MRAMHGMRAKSVRAPQRASDELRSDKTATIFLHTHAHTHTCSPPCMYAHISHSHIHMRGMTAQNELDRADQCRIPSGDNAPKAVSVGGGAELGVGAGDVATGGGDGGAQAKAVDSAAPAEGAAGDAGAPGGEATAAEGGESADAAVAVAGASAGGGEAPGNGAAPEVEAAAKEDSAQKEKPVEKEKSALEKSGSAEYNTAKAGAPFHREVSEILTSHFKAQWRQVWLRRKLPGEALPILPKPAGEKAKGGGGLTSPRQQQVGLEHERRSLSTLCSMIPLRTQIQVHMYPIACTQTHK